MRCVVSCSSPYFHGLYSSLQLCCEGPWFTTIQEDGCDKGAHLSYLGTEKNASIIPNWFQPCQCCCCLCYPGEYLRHEALIGYNWWDVRYATGASSKIRGRKNITLGTWNTPGSNTWIGGKLQKVTHELDRYRWHILGLCEMRWKIFGETTTEEGHKVFFSGKEDTVGKTKC